MVVGTKNFGVVSHLIVGGSGGILPQKNFVFFYPYDCIPAFSETDFSIYSIITLCCRQTEPSVKYLHGMFM